MTPTFKIKRPVLTKKYKDVCEGCVTFLSFCFFVSPKYLLV